MKKLITLITLISPLLISSSLVQAETQTSAIQAASEYMTISEAYSSTAHNNGSLYTDNALIMPNEIGTHGRKASNIIDKYYFGAISTLSTYTKFTADINDTNYEVTYNPNTIKWNRLNSKEGTLNNLHIQEMTKNPIGQVKETAKSLMSRVRTEVNQITPTLTIEEAELKTSNYKVNLKLDENTIVKVNDTNKDGKIEIRTNINLQYPDGTSHQIGEQTNFTRNTILWDLGNVSSVTISNNFAGFVLANNATIKVDGSFDGSLLGKCLNITSEIHRWDYQPKTPTPPTPVEPPVVPPVTPPVEPETPPETPVPTPPGEVTPPEEPTTPEPITPELPVIPEPEEPIVPTPEEPIPDIPTPEKPEIEVPEVEEPKEVEEPELKQEEEITNVQKDVEQGQESKEVKELPALGEYESIANALIALGIIFVGLALFETVRTIRRRK